MRLDAIRLARTASRERHLARLRLAKHQGRRSDQGATVPRHVKAPRLGHLIKSELLLLASTAAILLSLALILRVGHLVVKRIVLERTERQQCVDE